MLIETLLLFVLLSLGLDKPPGKSRESITLVDFQTPSTVGQAPEPASHQPAEQADERPVQKPPATQQPPPSRPSEPSFRQAPEVRPVPVARPTLPEPVTAQPSANVPVTPSPPASTPKRVYGPPDRGGSPALRDSERFGTAPNGEPLYAAAWYREPAPGMLRAYLSTARGPGWGLIACRTAPDYRVEDCVGLDEYPEGSQMKRAVLAAAWEFRVRPPRLGGRPLIGSWVRIRIDYRIDGR